MTAYGIFTFNGFDTSLDLVTQDKPSAAKHKHELVRDFGFETSEVKIVEMPDESAIYRIEELMNEQDLTFNHALKSVRKEIAAPADEVKE